MPQIYMIIGSYNFQGMYIPKKVLARTCFELLASQLIEAVEEVFGIKGLDDVAFTACEPAFYTKGEADVQIEIRYTAGKDEYKRGKPFEPLEEEQDLLAERIRMVFGRFLEGYKLPQLSLSVWCKPFYNSSFKQFGCKS